jgi:hypothetical protein
VIFVGTLVSVLLLGGAVVQTVSPPEYQEKQLLVFPAAYLVPIQTARDDFRKSHANWTCFRIIAVSQADDLEVNFSSPLLTTEDPRSGTITIGPQAKCGAAGATYLVTMDGKIIHRR